MQLVKIKLSSPFNSPKIFIIQLFQGFIIEQLFQNRINERNGEKKQQESTRVTVIAKLFNKYQVCGAFFCGHIIHFI